MSTFFKNNAVVKCETPEKAWNFADQLFCEMEANSYKRERSKTLLAFVESSMQCLDNENLINMFPDSNMPSDAYAEIVYRTTYSIVALGIYLKVKLKKETPEWLEQSLPIIMNAAFEKGIVAHGTNGWLDVIDIMKMLILAGARKFIEQNAQSATNFTRQMKMVMSYYANTIAESDQNPDKWAIGTKAMQSVLAAWDGYTHTIFVYGTLMRGEKSHKILAKEMYGGTAILDGYEIYDCFQYPGVMEKENRKVFGEVYFVREQTLEMIDFYENEGVLFRRKKVMLSGKLKGDVYVYYDCDNPCDLVLNRLWSTDLKKRVWYAGYGSNLSSKRFECYIRGGLCAENMVTYKGCTDKSGWRSDYFETFPGNLYFGNRSHSWNNYGVAFFDPDIAHKDPVVMHLYNISYGQLLDIQEQEGKSPNWYGRMVILGISPIDGAPIITLTSETRRVESTPMAAYCDMMAEALTKEGGFPSKEVCKYLKRCENHQITGRKK